jgi:hypothetical protein
MSKRLVEVVLIGTIAITMLLTCLTIPLCKLYQVLKYVVSGEYDSNEAHYFVYKVADLGEWLWYKLGL